MVRTHRPIDLMREGKEIGAGISPELPQIP